MIAAAKMFQRFFELELIPMNFHVLGRFRMTLRMVTDVLDQYATLLEEMKKPESTCTRCDRAGTNETTGNFARQVLSK